MFAAILMAGFFATHAVKEQEKIDYKKEKNRLGRLVCSEPITLKPEGANTFFVNRYPDYMRCENTEVICYFVYGANSRSISCIKKDEK